MPNHHSPLRVLFLLQRPEAWLNVASVWREMNSNPDFEPTVWLLPYNESNQSINDDKLKLHRKTLNDAGVIWCEWSQKLGSTLDQFDVAIFTHPYDRERPKDLWFFKVRSKIKTIIYIPYGLSVGAGVKNLRLQYAQPLQRGADLVVARSDAEKAMYARYCPSGASHVKVLGHPRFDMLLANLERVETGKLEIAIGARLAILWNSHFSFGHKYSQTANFSTFDLLGPDIFDYFIKNRSWACLLWRPHPGLFPELFRQGILRPEQIPAFRQELDLVGIVLDEAADHLPAFAVSHALMSDAGTFIIEYLALGKPLLPLINPMGEALNDESQCLVQSCGHASHFYHVDKFINDIFHSNNSLDFFGDLQRKYLPILDGKSGQRICSTLLGRDTQPQVDRQNFHSIALRTPISQPNHLEQSDDDLNLPVLRHLQQELRRIADEKAKEGRFKKGFRRNANLLRAYASEFIKQKM